MGSEMCIRDRYYIVGAGYDIITVQLSSFIIFVNLIEVVPLVDHLNLCTR